MKHAILYQAQLGMWEKWSLPVKASHGMNRWDWDPSGDLQTSRKSEVQARLGSGAAVCDRKKGEKKDSGPWDVAQPLWEPQGEKELGLGPSAALRQAQTSSGSRVAWVTAGVVTILTQEEITSKGLGVPVEQGGGCRRKRSLAPKGIKLNGALIGLFQLRFHG